MSIDGRALRSEGNGPVTSSTPQTEFVRRTPGKNASGKPSTKDDIQTVHLCAFTPPGSPLDQEATLNVLNGLNRLNVFNCSHSAEVSFRPMMPATMRRIHRIRLISRDSLK